MKTIFGIAILTAKDIDALNARIKGIEQAVAETDTKTTKQASGLKNFESKFSEAMDFIGRNLPLKRKRKAFRKIVDA